jgi:hypothetical protein
MGEGRALHGRRLGFASAKGHRLGQSGPRALDALGSDVAERQLFDFDSA